MTRPLSPAERFAPATGETGAILLETQRPDVRDRFSFLFRKPVRTLTARTLAEVVPCLEEAAGLQASGFAVAGFVAYEAGFALDDAFEKQTRTPAGESGTGHSADFPLVWFGVYDRWLRYDHLAKRWATGGKEPVAWPVANNPDAGRGCAPVPWAGALPDPAYSLSAAEHAGKVEAVRAAIARGDVYQANLTGTFRFPFTDDPYSLYLRLRAAQPVPFGAFLRSKDGCIVSQSPELFFRVRGRKIVTRPMKGTAAPGATDAGDRAAANALRHDPKNRAENVMIVDLLRNDLGRICETGTVRATRLFEVQQYRTVLQMVSTVSGTLRDGQDATSLFRALFPCGSITGAPRISAMRLLKALEPEARGIYTGAIGLLLPGGGMTFSVAIRTATIRDGVATAGAGGGIVWDSRAEDEYQEVFRKGRFLTAPPCDFRLIETMAWRPERGFVHLPQHLKRLVGSARHFGFPVNLRALRSSLDACVAGVTDGLPKRVRLLLDSAGRATVDLGALQPEAGDAPPWKVRLSRISVSSGDPFLRHKTTRRDLYDSERAAALSDGFDEVLFLNERGELTEGTITNVFLEIGGARFTPPCSCGLLNGVQRGILLGDPAMRASERVLTANDLRIATRILLANSVRGTVPAILGPGRPTDKSPGSTRVI